MSLILRHDVIELHMQHTAHLRQPHTWIHCDVMHYFLLRVRHHAAHVVHHKVVHKALLPHHVVRCGVAAVNAEDGRVGGRGWYPGAVCIGGHPGVAGWVDGWEGGAADDRLADGGGREQSVGEDGCKRVIYTVYRTNGAVKRFCSQPWNI